MISQMAMPSLSDGEGEGISGFSVSTVSEGALPLTTIYRGEGCSDSGYPKYNNPLLQCWINFVLII